MTTLDTWELRHVDKAVDPTWMEVGVEIGGKTHWRRFFVSSTATKDELTATSSREGRILLATRANMARRR